MTFAKASGTVTKDREKCHDGDDNEIAKKTIVCKCIQLFYIYFFPLLYDYDGKMRNFTFYGGRKQATAKFSFSF